MAHYTKSMPGTDICLQVVAVDKLVADLLARTEETNGIVSQILALSWTEWEDQQVATARVADTLPETFNHQSKSLRVPWEDDIEAVMGGDIKTLLSASLNQVRVDAG